MKWENHYNCEKGNVREGLTELLANPEYQPYNQVYEVAHVRRYNVNLGNRRTMFFFLLIISYYIVIL